MGGLVMGHGFGLRMIEGHIYIYIHTYSAWVFRFGSVYGKVLLKRQ